MSDPTRNENEQINRRSDDARGSSDWESILFRLSFDDGSVILVAERTAFRVHSSLLSRHSPPLKNIFSVPRTSEAEHHDRCPVFRLSDTAEDLDYLLQLIYDAPCLPPPFHSFRKVPKPTFAQLSAYIRLGDKYEIFALVDDAAKYLEAYFTTNFDVWETLRKGQREAPFTFSENPAADAIDTVNLARMTGKSSLLPLALYQCCQLDPVDLMEGVKRSEAETQVFSLSSSDIALCLRAKQMLLRASANVSAVSLLLNQCSEFEISKTCTDKVYGISTSGVLRLDRDLTTDPLGYGSGPSMDEKGLSECLGGPVELCWTCRHGAILRARLARQQIWSELPTYFDLPALDPFSGLVVDDPLVRENEDGD